MFTVPARAGVLKLASPYPTRTSPVPAGGAAPLKMLPLKHDTMEQTVKLSFTGTDCALSLCRSCASLIRFRLGMPHRSSPSPLARHPHPTHSTAYLPVFTRFFSCAAARNVQRPGVRNQFSGARDKGRYASAQLAARRFTGTWVATVANIV